MSNKTRTLGPDDEPQTSGAIVAVHWGDYRRQEIWVRSGANAGNWYCLGGEFGVPKVWDDNVPAEMWSQARKPRPERPPGTVPGHPDWSFVIRRGPVTLLNPGRQADYLAGWAAGRRALWRDMEDAVTEPPR